MKYALCLLTAPGREECLNQTLESFFDKVSPKPTEKLAFGDGYTPNLPGTGWDVSVSKRQSGFCQAVRSLWGLAYCAESSWVFWLEDDFEFNRTIDLRDLAHVLEHEPQVAQMALYRNAVNTDEVAAGGYMAMHPEEYQRRGGGARAWFEHRHHFTTNPSLFRRDLTSNEWPGDDQFCEGVFGLRLREARPETTFGVWGTGEEWIRHIGERKGFGY